MSKRKYLLQLFIVSAFFTFNAQKTYAVDSASIAYGSGEPDHFQGGRVALQWDWHKYWFEGYSWQLTGYWDLSAAYWDIRNNQHEGNNSLVALAAAPIFRLQKAIPFANSIQPYAEGSIGASYLTGNRFGHRDLGSHFAFQDIIGLGLRFGERQQYDISYSYMHYSNAGLFPPNQGIDVKVLLMFRYYL